MKKWIIIAVVVLLVAGGIVGAVILKPGDSSTGNSSQIGTIQLSMNDFKTKVIFTHPPELTGKWEKPTLSIVNIELIGTITNISSQTVSFEAYFLFDEQQVDIRPWTFGPIGPGESVKIMRNIATSEGWDKKVLEIKLVITTATQPTTTVPTTPAAQVFTSAPKNPKTPQEVTAAFYFYAYAGDYQKAMTFLEKEKPGLISYKEIEAMLKSAPGGLYSVKIDEVSIDNGSATVKLTTTVGDNPKTDRINLIKEDGVWRIRLSNFR